ncbi:MAG: hypothetical protein JST04_13715 [Bdellovibrionales bacterium]|nr:hypothetical protein [Bdellovibrionales bacterium]
MKTLIALLALAAPTFASAGQVLFSCDFAGYDSIADIQVKSTGDGARIEIYLLGETGPAYALTFEAETIGDKIDLGGFNYLNDTVAPRLEKTGDRWFFLTDDGVRRPVRCGLLR